MAVLLLPANASTTSDLRSLYGISTAADASLIISELSDVQRSIRSARTVEIYNAIVNSLSTEQVDNRIEELTQEADATYSVIMEGIDLPVEELLRLEAEYATMTATLNNLLNARATYAFEELPLLVEDLDVLLAREEALAESLTTALTFSDLGDLSYYPVTGTAYYVTSEFGYRYDPVGERGYSFHSGIDLRAPEGTPIGAWFNGVVLSTGYSYGSGNYIWLDHGDGVQSFYCHLLSIEVTVGDVVSQGDIIALSGNTGYYSTGPHLHLGLYLDGVAVDPAVVLG